MRRLILLLLLLAAACAGQDVQTGTITSASASCTATNCVYLDLPPTQVTAVTVQVVGAFTGTLVPEKTADGVTYVAAGASLTAEGMITYGIQAMTRFRVRAATLAAGTPAVTVRYSLTGGGGGGVGSSANGQILVNNTGSVGGIDPVGSGTAVVTVQGTPGFGKVPVGTSTTDVAWGLSSLPPEPQAGASYVYVGDDAGTPSDNDRAKCVIRTHTTAMTDTLGQAGTVAFPEKWYGCIKNGDAVDVLTVNVTTSTININGTAVSSFILNPGESIIVFSDGSNWYGNRGGHEYYVLFGQLDSGLSPNDGIAHYLGLGGNPAVGGQAYDGSNPSLVPRAGVVVEFCLATDVGGTLANAGSATSVIRKNDTTSSVESTSNDLAVRHSVSCVAPAAFTVAKGDLLNLVMTFPSPSTNPTAIRINGYARVVY